MSSKKDMNN